VGEHVGSIQYFIEDAECGKTVNQKDVENAKNIALFDCIIGNEDRHSGNYLWDSKKKRHVAIDNGAAFPEAIKPHWPRSVFLGKYTSKYTDGFGSSSLEDKHRKIIDDMIKNWNKYEEIMKPFISKKALRGVYQRVARIQETNRIGDEIKW